MIYHRAATRNAIVLALALTSVAVAQQPAPTQAKAAAARLPLAITFDDLPAHGPLPPGTTRLEIAMKIIRTLHAAKVPPIYGFVNAAELEHHPEEIAVLRAWRDAGNPLGNHT